jgi:hypothetical protein
MKPLLFLTTLIFLGSCQPSKITQRWSARDIDRTSYRQILVLAVGIDSTYILSTKMEDHMTEDLQSMGYNAIAAHKIYKPGTFTKGDTAAAVSAIGGKGFDAVFTMVLLEKGKEKFYSPGRITGQSPADRTGKLEKYLNAVTEGLYTPGTYGEQTKYLWECNFYDLLSKQMIYSARTRTFEYGPSTTLAHTFGQLLSNDLAKRKIIIKPAPELY